MAAPGGFAMPQGSDRRQAWWGVRYVSAICAQAGFAFQETQAESDIYSLDGQIFVKPGLSVSVQVKCTSRPLVRSRSYTIRPAWRRNWLALDLPGYFVVVSVPPATPDWMSHGSEPWTSTLRSAAFWTRIDPLDPQQQTISVHTEQRLTVETLEQWTDDLYEARQAFAGGAP